MSPRSRHSTRSSVPRVSALMSRRYEDYVDHKYKEHLKNQGKVDSVRAPHAATLDSIPAHFTDSSLTCSWWTWT